MRYDHILQAIGRTPLVRLNRINAGLKPQMYAKCDHLNPGGSVKDRIAVRMIDEAERKGLLKPGGTIIEGTSGNTGMGLALVGAVRGYNLIFTITDKQSREKINLLKALGAEVIVCPTAVAPDDPRSYYSIAKKLAREIPNSFYPNQYDNPDNPLTHYLTTGPEIWEDSEGRVTHFVAGMGTGGTISGIGKCLKERNPRLRVIGADPIGSLYHQFFHTGKIGEPKTYKIEGIGEDIFPSAMDFNVVDDVRQANDKDSFLMTRRLARLEGLFAGGSTGSAMCVALEVARDLTERDFLVVFIPDTGMRYLSKIYNDEWMRENQYVESEVKLTAGEIVRKKKSMKKLLHTRPSESVMAAMERMKANDVSQLPVLEDGAPIGAIHEDTVVQLLLGGKDIRALVVREIMSKPFPVLSKDARIEAITSIIPAQAPAVFVDLGGGQLDIITKYDLVHSISSME